MVESAPARARARASDDGRGDERPSREEGWLLQRKQHGEPDAFAKKLRIVRPLLSPSVNRLDVRRLAVGDATIDLRIRRAAHEIAVDVLAVNGDLEVIVDRGTRENPSG